MKQKQLSFHDIWEIINFSTYAQIAWGIIALLLMQFVSSVESFVQIFGWVVLFVAMGYVAHLGNKKKYTLKQIAKSGAYSGAIASLVGSILSLLAFYLSPDLFSSAISDMIAGGLSAEQAHSYFSIGLYVGIVIGPIFGGLIGAAFSALGSYLLKTE